MKGILASVCLLLCVTGCGWFGQARPWGRSASVASSEAGGPPQADAQVTDLAAIGATSMGSVVQAAATAPARPLEDYRIVYPPVVVEALALQVNDHTITVNDILHPIRDRLAQIPQGVSESSYRREAEQIIVAEVRRQTTEALVLDEAKRALAEEEKSQIEEELNGVLREMIALAGGSRARLEEDCRGQGTTLEEVLEARRRQMLARRYLNQKFLPQLGVTRDMLYRYYLQNRDAEFSSAATVQMQILCVPYNAFYPQGGRTPSAEELAAARQQARDRIAEATARIRQGADFGLVVKEYGQGYRAEEGGLWDFMEAGSFRESKVEKAAFGQEVGQVSDVVEGDAGCFLVKTVGRRAGEVMGFEKAQAGIEQRLRSRQYDELVKTYFGELYANATIASPDKFEQRVVDRAVRTYWRPQDAPTSPR